MSPEATARAGRPAGRGAAAASAPWVLVAGGFHERGGMDKANAALAAYLLERGTPLHLVAHAVKPELAAHPRATVHLVSRPAGSYLLGELLLARRGREVARSVLAESPRGRVLSNGGNCPWPDVNWVHAVHHAWPSADEDAPAWFRAKNRLAALLARRRERAALTRARVVIANSERTRRDLVEHLGLRPEVVEVVYHGSDAAPGAATAAEREAARASLGVSGGRLLIAFVGALGHDMNKGFDTLWEAWTRLCARGPWDADLIVAGGGRGVSTWRARAAASDFGGRVRVLGFTERVNDVLAASDLLVSPVRYESYGLNVQEAVCRGVPALVSRTAGVADLYPADLSEMLLPDPSDGADLAARLLRWRENVELWKRRFAPFAARLRRRTWADMSAEIVRIVEGEEIVSAAGGAAERVA